MLYSFVASTCTIVVVAYLLKRGPILAYLAGERLTARATVKLGLFFGLVGLVELYFAKERYPYDTYTLLVTFAALRCGGAVGLITAAIMAAGAPLILQQDALGRSILSVFFCLAAGLVVRRLTGLSNVRPDRANARTVIIAGLVTILLSEADSIMLRFWLGGAEAAPFSLSIGLLRVGANGVGFVLLHMIIGDALTRLAAERFRLEAERNRTLLAEAELSALRARIHPHFLFNALNSIAALTRIAPERAEAATVQLSHIMRRALDNHTLMVKPLEEEAEYVTDYVEIEKLRLGNRLQVEWDIPASVQMVGVPPFVLQTLVENSILHGIAPKVGGGTVRILARKRRRGGLLIAVADNGVGMKNEARRRALPPRQHRVSSRRRHAASTDCDETSPPSLPSSRRLHGLQIAAEQLCLVYGPRARLRLFSRRDMGTLAVFQIPRAELARHKP